MGIAGDGGRAGTEAGSELTRARLETEVAKAQALQANAEAALAKAQAALAKVQAELAAARAETIVAKAEAERARLSGSGTSPQRTTLAAPRPTATIAPEPDAGPLHAAIALETGLTRADRILIQRGLKELGFLKDEPDGIFGPMTRSAIRDLRASRGQPSSDYLEPGQIAELRSLGERVQPPPPRPAAPETTIVSRPAQVSPEVAEPPPAAELIDELKAPVGTFEITASREGLSYNKSTIARLRQLMEQVMQKLNGPTDHLGRPRIPHSQQPCF